jgi:hypothetical protein
MSGYISLSSDTGWQATSGLFRLVANFIADRGGSESLATQIHDMIEFNLPHQISLDKLSSADRHKVLKTLQDDLVMHAEETIPPSLDTRDELLDHIKELANLARSVPQQT